ncbi:ABC transporter ATP-binding protein [Clostridium omnivorum]|uniref:Daunorubicin resistance protein DrrA family ABC transporter ATP-binding protein n=1 Tax=Clostridium omnivorum TaxID=1604902 RepID=A0ABQ5N5D9_9CLOT|nr:ABC transporter ATP-binding protein [Clostridium sp. E14]GLC30443.1 daunorubicin resistance protein DrrA family ABC transporter ATP-binding protein [Clostridium sp. E14]
MEKAVEVKDIRKSFITRKKKLLRTIEKKEFKAVDGISFDIFKGEIFGLLGPNGAGKTTTIKMITGLLRPTSGKITVMGKDVDKKPMEALSNIGTVLAGDRSVYWKLTARENLEYFASLYGCSKKEGKKRAEDIINRLELSDKADVLVEKFSTGMKQKVALGKALIPNAPVVLLDEPTLGLDPQSALNLREIILDIKREGRTVLLTTHYMEEADFLCDRIAIVDGGKVIALDTPENLKKSLNEVKCIKIEVNKAEDKLINELKDIPKIEKVKSDYDSEKRNYTLTIHHTNGDTIIQKIIDIISKNKSQILNINVLEPSLEDVFIHLTGKSLRE